MIFHLFVVWYETNTLGKPGIHCSILGQINSLATSFEKFCQQNICEKSQETRENEP